MADFKISNKKTARNEGGYTNVREDGGNWTGGKVGVGQLIGTNLGISAPVLSAYLGRTATVNDMASLTHEVAEKIYIKNYWNPMRGDEILNQEIADSIYDSCVNMGCHAAIELAQKSLGMVGKQITGTMTNDTLKLLNNQ